MDIGYSVLDIGYSVFLFQYADPLKTRKNQKLVIIIDKLICLYPFLDCENYLSRLSNFNW